jgi:Cu-processing system permease protein
VARGPLFTALYLGHSVPLALALVVGILAPFAWHGLISTQVLAVAGVAALLAMISSAVAHLIAVRIDDRVRALATALGVWITAAVVWDGLVLLIAMQFGHRPIETPLLAMLAVNPLDLGRLLILLGTDAAALLGYTGAVLERTLGTATGRGAVVAALACWTVLPLLAARRAFTHKDF